MLGISSNEETVKPRLYSLIKDETAESSHANTGIPQAMYSDSLCGLLMRSYSPYGPAQVSIESPSQTSPKPDLIAD